MARVQDSGGAGDPLALWRHKDPLLLGEAAALLAGEPPGRTYLESDSGDRKARDSVYAFQTALVDALVSEDLVATVVMKHTGGERLNGFNTPSYQWESRFGKPIPRYAPAYSEMDMEKSTVLQADLRAWCERRKLSPAFFASSEASAPTLGQRERQTLFVLVGVLAELAGLDMTCVGKGHVYAEKLHEELKDRKCTRDTRTIAAKLFEAKTHITPIGKGWKAARS
jgi:hypothetical protein